VDIHIGDRIIYDGYPPTIPMRLAGTRGTVEQVTKRGVLVTRADEDAYGVRRIRPHMVQRIFRAGQWVRPPWKNPTYN
jgi:hypothetical protein